MANHFENEYVSSIKSNNKGFLQIKLNDKFIEDRVNDLMDGLTFPEDRKQNVVVDFYKQEKVKFNNFNKMFANFGRKME